MFQTIVHPTDFSDLSFEAFAHALRIALIMQSKLYLVHVAESKCTHEDNGFPHIRRALEQWRLLSGKEAPTDVADKLGIRVAKISLKSQDLLHSLLRFIDQHSGDLLVLATHGRNGVAHWLRGSIAEELSRLARLLALFISPSGWFCRAKQRGDKFGAGSGTHRSLAAAIASTYRH